MTCQSPLLLILKQDELIAHVKYPWEPKAYSICNKFGHSDQDCPGGKKVCRPVTKPKNPVQVPKVGPEEVTLPTAEEATSEEAIIEVVNASKESIEEVVIITPFVPAKKQGTSNP